MAMAMEMTICDLPMDLLGEIVCRLPLKDMRAVRLTCKKWDTLSKSEGFRKMHMCNVAAREEGESRMVALMNYNLHLISVNSDHPSTEIKGTRTPLSDEEQVKIVKAIHCDGLLLCVLKDSFRLVVWNPYLGQTRWIEPPFYSYRCRQYGCGLYSYALGYDHKKKAHKILRFIDACLHDLPRRHYICYEIYDFDSNSWRTLDVGTPHWSISFRMTAGFSISGNTYWLATERNSVSNLVCDGFNRLVCFDFTSERFGPTLPLPLPSQQDFGDVYVDLSSLLKGDKLAMLVQTELYVEAEIWVTTMIEPNNVSWCKFLTVDTRSVLPDPHYDKFTSMGFFIDEEKKLAMIFDESRDTRYMVDIIRAGFHRQVYVDLLVNCDHSYTLDSDCVCPYVPSLVQIRKPPSRKRRSNFQLRPCHQNKSSRLDEEEHSAKRKRRT